MTITYAHWLKGKLEEVDLIRYGSGTLAAELLGVSKPTLWRWLNGHTTPSGNQLLRIAAAFAGNDHKRFAELLLEQVSIQAIGTTDYTQFLAKAQ
jgi:transcriptional regulator with XRE-family HTH domain